MENILQEKRARRTKIAPLSDVRPRSA